MKRVSLLMTAGMGLVCAVYVATYLVRWEWNRAILAALFFVAVEVVLLTGLLVERIHRLEQSIERLAANVGDGSATLPGRRLGSIGDVDSTLDAIEAAAPDPRDHFAWLRDQGRTTNVFLPVLLGAGVLASALAWAVEHVARATLSPVFERRLATRLGAIAAPTTRLLDRPRPPVGPGPRRSGLTGALAAVVAVIVAVVGTIGLLDFVADRTQNRPDQPQADVQTVIHLELRGALADRDPIRIVGHLWAACTGPDVFRQQALPAAEFTTTSRGVFRIAVDADVGEHGMARLRGCLNDNTLDKVQATVLATAVAPV